MTTSSAFYKDLGNRTDPFKSSHSIITIIFQFRKTHGFADIQNPPIVQKQLSFRVCAELTLWVPHSSVIHLSWGLNQALHPACSLQLLRSCKVVLCQKLAIAPICNLEDISFISLLCVSALTTLNINFCFSLGKISRNLDHLFLEHCL